MKVRVALKRAGRKRQWLLLVAGVLGDSFRAFGHSVLGKFSRQQQANGGLYLTTSDGGSLVVVRQSGRFSGYPLEDVVHEAVHDRHGFATDAGVWVHLLKHLIDVYRIALLPSSFAFFISSANGLRFPCLFSAFRTHFRWHDSFACTVEVSNRQYYVYSCGDVNALARFCRQIYTLRESLC